MKIISQPQFSDWKLRVNCSRCTSVLEIVAKDIKHKISPSDRYSGDESYYGVDCPICSNFIYVPPNKMPAGMENMIKLGKV